MSETTLPKIFIELLGNGLKAQHIGSLSASVFLCIFLFLLFRVNYLQVIEFFERIRERRLTRLEKYVEDLSVDAEVLKVVKDIRSGYVFERATGFYGERAYRQALLAFYRKLEGANYYVTWWKLRHCRSFIRMENGAIEIHFMPIDWLYRLLCNILAIMALLFALNCFLKAFSYYSHSLLMGMSFGMTGLMGVLVATFLYYQSSFYSMAKAMQAALLLTEKKNTNSVEKELNPTIPYITDLPNAEINKI